MKAKANNKTKSTSTEQQLDEFKVAVVGGGGVGKSALTIQFIQNVFIEEYDPTIEDSYRKHVKVDDKPAFLEILDTAGQEEYKALRDNYMRSADGFLLVFDVTQKKSFQEIEEFYEHILRVKDCDSFPMVLVGNKCDLESERGVTTNEAKLRAKEMEIKYIETSARKRLNIDECFMELIRDIRKVKQPVKEILEKKQKKCTLL
ncbi:hypothetical protein ABK040_001178 [Willaertia magna]